MKRWLAIFIGLWLVLSLSLISPASLAKGGAGRGGVYVGGSGSSHKGGHYVNPATGNHYTKGGLAGYSSDASAYRSSSYARRSSYGSGAKPSYAHMYRAPLIFHSSVARDESGKIARSESAKLQYLRSRGYSNVPAGYNVDHVVPLYAGGCDCPANMQLISVSAHHAKTKADFERYIR